MPLRWPRVTSLVWISLATMTAAAPVGQAAPWAEVVARYATVHDYTCRYVKEERAIDHGEPQTILLSFRKPLDVRMEWLNDRGEVDQIAVYRQGMNDGQVIARRKGVLGSMIGTLHLDPRDRRALEDSRHPITEVGFGPIVAGIARALEDGTATLRSAATVESGRQLEFDVVPGASLLDVAGARCITVVVGPAGLPVSVEIFDASAARLERHRFSDIRLNVGLTDAVFTL